MLLITKTYEALCEKLGWKPRYFILELFRRLDEALKEGDRALFLVELPAGYGKSLATTLTLAKRALERNPYFTRVIHVLPMRSIIDDLCRRLTDGSKRVDPRISTEVAAQYMLRPGSPFFVKKCVVTTLDTFVLNFFKLPAHEIHKAFKYNTAHFEFPRGMIYSSIVVLDEVHLFTGLGTIREESKSLTAVLAMVECLLEAGVPIVMMTATMPDQIKKIIKETVELSGSRLEKIEYQGGFDSEFDKELAGKIKRLYKISELTFDGMGQYNRVGFIFNTVGGAIECYKRLREQRLSKPVFLVHGRMPESRRKPFLEELDKKESFAVVATQVIEAGVDLDFDLMITECCPPDRLVQRAGRVARKSREGEIWVLKAGEAQPYDKGLIELTWNELESIDRIDYETGKELITKVYSKVRDLGVIERLRQSLKKIDQSPLVGKGEAKEAFEFFQGFTDSAGLVSVFREGNYDPKEAIALSGDEIRRELLKSDSKVSFLVDNRGTTKNASREDLRREESISIYMLKQGYKGLVIDNRLYAELTGLDII